ncbi:50S ribosomal protein L20 [Halobacillus litoralis]|uniref:Large ribosomal subunit protein bL20 n=4 Tax=Halobacillus TaxID=45667 RepID=A0A845E4X1_9BACI|nr:MULTISPECIES: 50S ribosomal protein L20 [Halobacillus]MBN9655321.1 50S ribosomal protein L20 [Halobacillus sp. GSS1]MBX0358994.1 50S ribosomal protein L20 [Halobacillus sp. Nhm2S1]MEC3882852.1 50S ribosomal protein L20 [Halobacillus sp. HZG1]MYL50320.1 50S ribosomal protein L20 [Halobacillus litoralis]MYL72265.1 50S ribosomal protein L20 [Halobacillus litoralis]
MPRVKGGTVTRQRRNRVLKLAKGYYGSKHALFKTAKQQVMKSGQYAYRDRRQKKRDFRKLWIARINAAARLNDISYSRLMHGLKLAGVEVNRKMLADLAVNDEQGFASLAEQAKSALK